MAGQSTKNISLTPHFKRFIEKQVKSGRYQSASEVVRESLRQMEERSAARDNARAIFDQAWNDSNLADGRDGEEFMTAMRQELTRKLKAGNKAKRRPPRAA